MNRFDGIETFFDGFWHFASNNSSQIGNNWSQLLISTELLDLFLKFFIDSAKLFIKLGGACKGQIFLWFKLKVNKCYRYVFNFKIIKWLSSIFTKTLYEINSKARFFNFFLQQYGEKIKSWFSWLKFLKEFFNQIKHDIYFLIVNIYISLYIFSLPRWDLIFCWEQVHWSYECFNYMVVRALNFLWVSSDLLSYFFGLLFVISNFCYRLLIFVQEIYDTVLEFLHCIIEVLI